jgi:hypothetical protein
MLSPLLSLLGIVKKADFIELLYIAFVIKFSKVLKTDVGLKGRTDLAGC